MKAPTVDSIMSKPVDMVDAGELVLAALDIMKERGTKKILVTENGKPIGVLEKWMVTASDRERRLGDMELRAFGRVRLGISLSEVREEVERYSAVYIFGPDDPNKPVGVLTAYDLARAL